MIWVIPQGAKIQCHSCGDIKGTFNRTFFSSNPAGYLGQDVDWVRNGDNPLWGENDDAHCVACGKKESFIKSKPGNTQWHFKIFVQNFGWWPKEEIKKDHRVFGDSGVLQEGILNERV